MNLRLWRVCILMQAVLISLVLAHCAKDSEDEAKEEGPAGSSNRPPVVKSAGIHPEYPTAQEDLRVVVNVSDPEGDPVTLAYQWMINGQEVRNAIGEIFYAGSFEKGDLIQCMIIPADEADEGEPAVTEPVRVANAHPVLDDIRFEPRVLRPGGEASVVIEAHDPDGDDLTYICEWYVNDELVQEEGETCSLENLKKNDRVYVRVSVSDGEVQRQWEQSRVVAISNRPPQITSTPPSAWNPEEGFLYAVQTTDPDGDAVQVSIEGEIPPGTVWDEDTATLTWIPPEDAEGAYHIKIVADDGDGGVFVQEFALTLKTQEEGE